MSAIRTVRKTVTIDDAKMSFIERALEAGTPEALALSHLSGSGPFKNSESAVINRLIELGIAKVQEESTKTGYAALAAEQVSELDRAHKRMARRNSARSFQQS